MLETFNAVIFDMDGVIFDSEKMYFDAFFIAADKHEIDVDAAFVHRFTGITSSHCLLMLDEFFDYDTQKTQLFARDWLEARLSLLHEQGLRYKEGFIELFKSVKKSNKKIGLVTSSNRADMEDNFSRNNAVRLDDFDHIITIDEVKNPKPHPEPYQMMIRQLGLLPEQCVVIEDSITGASAALAAKANTIMITEYTQLEPTLIEKLWYVSEHHDNILQFLKERGL